MGIELNKIYNEDCLIGMQRIPDGTVDAIICDLPYGTTRNQWDSIIPLDALWEQYKRVIKPNGAIVLFAQTPFDKVLGASNLPMLKYEWIWEKHKASGFLNAKKYPLKVHENILVFCDGVHPYNPQGLVYRPHYNSRKSSNGTCTNYQGYGQENYSEYENYPKDILNFRHDEGKDLHPTQKPVDLIRYLIRTYTNEGDTILDNCMGSGTTAIAAIRERRNYIGFEMNTDYWQKANERIKRELSQPTLF